MSLPCYIALHTSSVGWKTSFSRRFEMSTCKLLALAVLLMVASAALAQELAATLTGTVTDPSGAVVGGATIVVHNLDTGADVRTVATTSAGSFNITNVPAGR